MITELFIIEAKLIHKVSGHLLYLVVWEGLRQMWQFRLQNTQCYVMFSSEEEATCCNVSSLGKGLSISSSEEDRGFPLPIWSTNVNVKIT